MKTKKALSALTVIAIASSQMPAAFASEYTNPNVESVFFVDRYGNTVLEPDGRDDIIPYVVVSKAEGSPTAGGTAAVAVYDNAGRLFSTQLIDVTKSNSVYDEIAYKVERWTLSGEEMSYPEGGYAKAFWWESGDSMKPNAAAVDDAAAPTGEYNGALVLPEPYKTLMDGRFTITKEAGVRNYSHNATPQSLYDWDSATEVFISYNGAQSGLGDSAAAPITMQQFVSNFNADSYGDKKDFVFTITDDIYSGTAADAVLVGASGALGGGANLKSSVNALIRSGSDSGFTWFGQRSENPTVTADSGIYKAVLPNAANVIPVDLKAVDAYGMPKSYNLVASLDDCRNTKGTYYQAAASDEVYVNLYDGEKAEDIEFYELAPKFKTGGQYTGTLVFENIGFMPNAINDDYNRIVGGSYNNTRLGFFGCKFYRGAHNTLGLQGKYTAFVFDCVNAYGARDGFNYHADFDSVNDNYSTAIEINSISYKQGSFNQMYGSEKNTNSNNASTGHDGMNILRVGGRYWQAEGPIIADGNCFTINIGCEAYNFVTSSPSERSTFMAHNDDTTVRGGKEPNKYFIDCYGTGVKIRAGVVSCHNSYVLDLKGNETIALGNSGNPNPLNSITWEEIAAGGIKMYDVEPETPEITVFKSSDAYSSEQQGTNGWNFQYAMLDDTDYTDYDIFDGGWFNGIKNNWAYGGVSAKNTMHPGYMADAVKTFECPKDGTVKLTSEDNIRVAAEKSDGVNLKILQNDIQIWPESGWQLYEYGTTSTFEPVTIDVRAGDKLYFRANCNTNNNSDTIYWSPVVEYVQPEEKAVTDFELSGLKTEYSVGDSIDRSIGKLVVTYEDDTTQDIAFSNAFVEVSGFDTASQGTKTVTVSYKGITKTYEIYVAAAPIRSEYNAYTDMSDTQGKNSWYYKYALVGQYKLSDYVEYPFKNNGVWMKANGDFEYGRLRMNSEDQTFVPGNHGDVALTFKAPAGGRINLSVLNDTITEISSTDIDRMKIYKNEEQIFPQEAGEWLVMGAGDIYSFTPMDIAVSEGDEIIFRVNKGSDNWDNVDGARNDGDKMSFVPVIRYTEIAGVKDITGIAVSDVKTEYNLGDDIDRSAGKVIVTYDDASTDEIPFANSLIELDGFDTSIAGSKTVTVTYKGFSNTYDITVLGTLSKTYYNAYDDMSEKQGNNYWYYKYAPLGKYTLADYNEYEYSKDGYWLFAEGDWQFGRIRMSVAGTDLSSGSAGDAALTFVTPVDGNISVSMLNDIITEGGSTDITRFRIYKNEEQIFPAEDGEWLTMKRGDTYNFTPMDIAVSAGDQIIFRVNKGSETGNTSEIKNDGDKLVCVPIIEFLQ